MHNNISQHDITELANLSCGVIHRIDFPEVGELDLFRSKLINLLDKLEYKYQNNELLFDLRSTIFGCHSYKPAQYELVKKVIQMATTPPTPTHH